MTIPTPPVDLAGGILVLKYTDGTSTHRMRVHVNAFNDDATGTYVVTAGGLETSLQETFANLAYLLAQGLLKSTFTITQDAQYHISGGVATQTFVPQPGASVAGALSGTAGRPETFECFSMRTVGGHRMRQFVFQTNNWAFAAAANYAPSNSLFAPAWAYYLTGNNPTGTSGKSQVVGHDGTAATGNVRVTFGLNKKLRRKAGDA